MRRIVVSLSVSLDGFFEGPDHDLSWHLVDEELHTHHNEQIASMSALLEGRVTYERMAEGGPTPAMREFAGIWRDLPKIVFSRPLERADWNATIRREVDPDEIRALQHEP